MTQSEERKTLVLETVADIRAIEARDGVTRMSLERIKQRLMRLAARNDLFTTALFPPPAPGEARNSCLYRLSEDPDHRFALYANSAGGQHDTPAHDHTTWAVIVGLEGRELNRFYERTAEGGVRETGRHTVERGTGVAFLPDELHSIHIGRQDRLLNFHMYGLALEQLHRREYWKPEERSWAVFPAHSDIREARGR